MHAGRHVRPHAPPRLGRGCEHAAGGHRRRVQGHRPAARRLAHGDGFEVIFGGGRDRFLPRPERSRGQDRKGSRKDGRNLVQEWQNRYSNSGAFVWNKEQFDKLDAKTPHVLGLFERSHMRYEADRSRTTAASHRSRR